MDSTADTLRPSTSVERAVVMVVACVLTVVLTYPTVPRFATDGRLDTGDGRFSIWNVAWVAHALLDDPMRLFDANIFHPHRHTLIYSELNLVAGVFGVPAYAVTRSAAAALNGAVVSALLLTFVAMWALVRRLTGSSHAGLVAATAYTFSAYTSTHTAHIQLLMLFGFPLTMLAFHRLCERPTIGAGAWLGAALALTALSCGYYGVFAAELVGISAFWWASRQRHYWLALGVAVVASVLLVLPALGPYLYFRAADSVVRGTNSEELQRYSANWIAYLSSSTALGIHWTAQLMKLGPVKEVLFPGLLATTLAGACLMRLRSHRERWTILGYAVIAVIAFWASLGPSGGLYLLLAQTTPGMSFLRAPARLGPVVIFTVCVLAGFGYRLIAKERVWAVTAALMLLVAELWVVWPLRPMPPLPRAYQMLAILPPGPVIEFPFPYLSSDFHNQTRAMLRSTSNWLPLVNGYSDFIPPDFYDLALPVNAFPDPRSFELLRARGVRYVVLRLNEYGAYRDTVLARYTPYEKHFRLWTTDQDVRLYEIATWPEAGQP